MVVLELAFDDDPARLELRPAHRELLTALHAEGKLVMSGPWTDETGALLVFNTDREGLVRIMADDPYYSAPGVRIAAIHDWNPIIGV